MTQSPAPKTDLVPEPSSASGTSSGHDGMFDIAEEIRRLCRAGTSARLQEADQRKPATTDPFAPLSGKPTERATADPDTVPAPVLPLEDALDFLSPHCLTSIAESLARHLGQRSAIVVLSPTGTIVESGQYGWRPSDFRSQVASLQSVARECAWGKTGTYYFEHIDAPESIESPHGSHVRPSRLLAQWGDALGEKDLVTYSIGLPESQGHAVILSTVPTQSALEFFSRMVVDNGSPIANQLDTWLLLRRSRSLHRWMSPLVWIRANPHWCALPAILVMAAMLVPVPYFPKRNCVMEPEARQFIASPIQGRIASCLVQPGDTVEAGQLLATIADDQLQRDLATARAQLESAEQKSNAALSSKTSGNYAQAMLEQEKAALEIESITRQLERLEVRSPVPGVVLYGDLRKSVGMPVTLGQNLFEVAELHSMTAEIQLTASDLEQIHVGDSVTVRSDATGFRGFHGTIHRIEPRATIIDNSAIFVADVIINDSADQLRPGMKATARIDAGWRSIGWLMFHRPLQWLAQQWVW